MGKGEKRIRTQSYTSQLPEFPILGNTPAKPAQQNNDRRRTSNKLSTGGATGRKARRKGHLSQISTKDLGRWKPTDDLALILGVQQVKKYKLL